MTNSERQREIILLWLHRSRDERTRNHVLTFYAWLKRERPDLVPVTRRGDPYQKLQSMLTHHITGGR